MTSEPNAVPLSVRVPEWSVVIPTCNRPESLAACLRQLAPGVQTLPSDRYEVIVTDDGAIRPAGAMITAQFPWVRWAPGPRRGSSANRNHGAARARGTWLAFTDDDCLPGANWLEAFAAATATSADVAVFEGRTVTDRPLAGPFESAPVNESGGLLWSCNFAIRTEVFRRLEGFDEDFRSNLEDVDFHARVRRAGLVVQFLASATVVHPPRGLRPVLRQVHDHRSYFQFARKYDVSLREAGLNLHAFVRWRWMALRSGRTVSEVVRYGVRCVVEIACLVPLCVGWWFTVRRSGARQ